MERYVEWADTVIGKIREKMEWVSEKNRDKIPYQTDQNGDYDDRSDLSGEWNVDDGLNWWTNGFWGGIMWLLYQDTGEERYAQIARLSEEKLERCFQDFHGLH
ncbi:MAG: glycosyl hydrolase family 88, partial [Acetatifactor sp.]|nr:glycosyl hydrolase family 88 [Acetatifactor sp.]